MIKTCVLFLGTVFKYPAFRNWTHIVVRYSIVIMKSFSKIF